MGLRSRLWPIVCACAALIVVVACIGIVVYVIYEGIPAVSWEFISTDPIPTLDEAEAGGVRTALVGTMLLIFLSLVVTLPFALATAVYLAEYMEDVSRLTAAVRLGLEVLASVPSVVFGMFGIALFSQPVFTFLSSSGAQGARAAFGRSFMVASIVMAIHVLPFVAKVMEEAIRSVPKAYRDAAAGLGIPKWRTLRLIVLPSARRGLATAGILGTGLIAGDTAIVWLTLGGTLTMGSDAWWMPGNWLEVARGTGSTLTTYTYFTSPAGEGMAPTLAFGSALILMVLVLVLNLGAMALSRFGGQDDR